MQKHCAVLEDALSVQGGMGKITGEKRPTLPPGPSLCSVWRLSSCWATVHACHLSQNELLRTRKVMELLIRCLCVCVCVWKDQ